MARLCNFGEVNSCSYGALEHERPSLLAPRHRTQQPTYTGASVMGMRYENGIVIAADMSVSGGKSLRMENRPRILKINDHCLMAVSGDYADFQYLQGLIEAKVIDEERQNEGYKMKPRSLYAYLSRLLYQRRNKFNPLWLNIVVGGIQEKEPFLGHVDMLGTAFETYMYSTAFGNYLGMGLMRDTFEKKEGNLSKEEAVSTIKDVVRVLYYRDCQAYPKYQIGICSPEGTTIEGPLTIDSNWESAKEIYFD